MNENMVIER